MLYSAKSSKGFGIVPATFIFVVVVAISKYLTKETRGKVCIGSWFESTECHGGKAPTGTGGNISSAVRKQRDMNAGAHITLCLLQSTP